MTWWTDEAEVSYEKLTECFIQQYSSYEIANTNHTVDGNMTLDENVCDFAGFQQAFRAYQSIGTADARLPGLTSYSPEQIFFIQYAQLWCEVTMPGLTERKDYQDNHSPGRFRSNGVVVNDPRFGKLFGCSYNSPMNPPHKCKLWSSD